MTTTTKQYLEIKEHFQHGIFTQMYFAHMVHNFQVCQLFHHTNWEPPNEDIPSSLCLHVSTFLATLQPHYSQGQCAPSNLTPPQCAIFNTLQNDCHFIVFLADKNLELCVIEHDEYFQCVLTNHLSDGSIYHHLPFPEACNILESTELMISMFIVDYCQYISPADHQYLK